jgi:AcrR family transcriptional regulator
MEPEKAVERRSFIEKARRSQIIRCAIDAIAELGYANTSLAQIAQRAGVSKGVISYHFAGKEELVREVVKEVFQIGGQYIGSRIIQGSTPRAQLRAYIESNVEFMGVYRKELLALVSILVYARTQKGEVLFGAGSDDPILDATEKIFIEGQKIGEFRPFATRPMAIALRGAIDAVPGKLMFNPDFDLSAYAQEIAELFDRGTRAG